MSLLEDFESFYEGYISRSKSLDFYANNLSALLDRLAEDPLLETIERDAINEISAVLGTDLDQIKYLDLIPNNSDKEKKVRELQIQIRKNINDFKHNPIYRRFRQRCQENPALTGDNSPRPTPSATTVHDRSQTMDSKAQLAEEIEAAVAAAVEFNPHATAAEIYTMAISLERARLRAVQQSRLKLTSRAPDEPIRPN
ncbi:MAG TPA: hypothetical protein VGA99_10945 [bacterium]